MISSSWRAALAAPMLTGALLLTATSAIAQPKPKATTTFAVDCRVGDAVKADERAAVERIALEHYGHVLAGRSSQAIALTSPDNRANTAADAYERLAAWAKRQGDFGAPKVTSVMVLDVQGAPPERTTVCERGAGASDAYVTIDESPRQAYVLIDARAGEGTWTAATWLRHGSNGWMIDAFDVRNTIAGAHTGDTILAAARAQKAAGAELNAKLLYRLASGLSDRGPNVTLPLHEETDSEMDGFWPGLSGETYMGVNWNDGRTDYGAHDIAAIGDTNGLYTILFRQSSIWPGARAVDAENRAFITSYMKKNPDWSKGFKGVYVEALHPDGEHSQVTSFTTGEGWSDKPK